MADPIPFEEMREFFTDELEYGQLCDIVVGNADVDAWSAFLKSVVPRYAHTFSLGTKERTWIAPIPENVAAMFLDAESEQGPRPSLGLTVLDLPVRVFFYGHDELELDVWRTEVTPERYLALAELMERMGVAARRDVFMTPESDHSSPAMLYDVKSGVFRRTREGRSAEDAPTRESVRATLRSVLAPICAGSVNWTDIDALQEAYGRLNAIYTKFSELELQDSLEPGDRGSLDYVVSKLGLVLFSEPSSSKARGAPYLFRDLVVFASKLER